MLSKEKESTDKAKKTTLSEITRSWREVCGRYYSSHKTSTTKNNTQSNPIFENSGRRRKRSCSRAEGKSKEEYFKNYGILGDWGSGDYKSFVCAKNDCNQFVQCEFIKISNHEIRIWQFVDDNLKLVVFVSIPTVLSLLNSSKSYKNKTIIRNYEKYCRRKKESIRHVYSVNHKSLINHSSSGNNIYILRVEYLDSFVLFVKNLLLMTKFWSDSIDDQLYRDYEKLMNKVHQKELHRLKKELDLEKLTIHAIFKDDLQSRIELTKNVCPKLFSHIHTLITAKDHARNSERYKREKIVHSFSILMNILGCRYPKNSVFKFIHTCVFRAKTISFDLLDYGKRIHGAFLSGRSFRGKFDDMVSEFMNLERSKAINNFYDYGFDNKGFWIKSTRKYLNNLTFIIFKSKMNKVLTKLQNLRKDIVISETDFLASREDEIVIFEKGKEFINLKLKERERVKFASSECVKEIIVLPCKTERRSFSKHDVAKSLYEEMKKDGVVKPNENGEFVILGSVTDQQISAILWNLQEKEGYFSNVVIKSGGLHILMNTQEVIHYVYDAFVLEELNDDILQLEHFMDPSARHYHHNKYGYMIIADSLSDYFCEVFKLIGIEKEDSMCDSKFKELCKSNYPLLVLKTLRDHLLSLFAYNSAIVQNDQVVGILALKHLIPIKFQCDRNNYLGLHFREIRNKITFKNEYQQILSSSFKYKGFFCAGDFVVEDINNIIGRSPIRFYSVDVIAKKSAGVVVLGMIYGFYCYILNKYIGYSMVYKRKWEGSKFFKVKNEIMKYFKKRFGSTKDEYVGTKTLEDDEDIPIHYNEMMEKKKLKLRLKKLIKEYQSKRKNLLLGKTDYEVLIKKLGDQEKEKSVKLDLKRLEEEQMKDAGATPIDEGEVYREGDRTPQFRDTQSTYSDVLSFRSDSTNPNDYTLDDLTPSEMGC